jgi:N-acetylated-alpha-linked acidic dipeptidase
MRRYKTPKHRGRLFCAGVLLLFLQVAYSQKTVRVSTLAGFTRAGAAREREIEEQFKKIPSSDKAREWHRFLTAEPHPPGSDRNNMLADYIADRWREQGWEDVKVHRYEVLVSSPRDVFLEMTAPVKYRASLREDPYEKDPDTLNPNISPGYLALSASGEVTAPLVYANSGSPSDYEVLKQKGIDVRGKVVLVRYSNPYSYRGFKAYTAQQLGAAAILIYSDPEEDGYAKGKVFPDGPWGPDSHIQRGAITYDFLAAGDPLTPGWPSLPGARHLAMEETPTLPKIIALPLSWRDAKPLLENIGGPDAPTDWQGGIPVKYRMGGSEATIHLKVDMNNRLGPNYVVEARIAGSEFPEEWVLFGNHRDAWEFGGVDPSSGTASMLELTRALGELKKSGIRPKRTLVACSWDGEEVGLTGSTEWGEQFADDLRSKLVAYINVDSSTSGSRFMPSAVASLAPLIVSASADVKLPSGRSLLEAWRADQRKVIREAGGSQSLSDNDMVDVRIGSGSDHAVFLNFLGRPTIGLSFEGPYGVYHSIYDDFYWVGHFGDPGYVYHRVMAQIWGLIILRLSNADILPFDFRNYSVAIRRFASEIARMNGVSLRLNLLPLFRRIDEFSRAGESFNRAVGRALSAGRIGGEGAGKVNRKIMAVEGNWLHGDGIPGRPWFKHLLYAARYTYAHLELPGLTEAVERKDWKAAAEQEKLLEQCLQKNTALLLEAAAGLGQ